MDSTAVALARVNAFARAVKRDLASTGVPYALVGGIAVIHHGYVRATTDIDEERRWRDRDACR